MGTVETDKIAVHFDGKKCIHARRCVLGLPDVFSPGAKGQWIFPENATTDEIVRLVQECPSGALTYGLKVDQKSEEAPRVNTARLWENGPVEYRGDVQIEGEEPTFRAVLCRCGASKNKPFCDGSHKDIGFEAD